MDIFIVHGYRANVAKHWLPWLAQKLTEQGNRVKTVELPTPETPKRDQWVAALYNTIGVPNKNTIIITHSLGGYTTLFYLNNLTEDWSLNGLILVSGFKEPLKTIPDLDIFLDKQLDTTTFSDKINYIRMIHSDDDTVVPPELSIALGKELHAKIIEIPSGGHFIGEDFLTLPSVLTETQEIIAATL